MNTEHTPGPWTVAETFIDMAGPCTHYYGFPTEEAAKRYATEALARHCGTISAVVAQAEGDEGQQYTDDDLMPPHEEDTPCGAVHYRGSLDALRPSDPSGHRDASLPYTSDRYQQAGTPCSRSATSES